jgi:hypothetical protein
MKTTGAAPAAMLIGIFVVICCTGPLLIAAVGTTALAAWLSYSGYVLTAAVLIAVGGGVLWLRHRRRQTQDRYRSEALNKAPKHE